MSLLVYSGECCQCDAGRPTGELDMYGEELFTGDLVMLWHGQYIGEDCEQWLPSGSVTYITCNQYRSFSDGSVELIDENAEPFTMGIKTVGVKGCEWDVSLVKSHRLIIAGERYKHYGLNYREATNERG